MKKLHLFYTIKLYGLFAQAGHRGHRHSKHQPVPELLKRIPLPRQHKRGLQPASLLNSMLSMVAW